jgi:hypothetical protein
MHVIFMRESERFPGHSEVHPVGMQAGTCFSQLFE